MRMCGAECSVLLYRRMIPDTLSLYTVNFSVKLSYTHTSRKESRIESVRYALLLSYRLDGAKIEPTKNSRINTWMKNERRLSFARIVETAAVAESAPTTIAKTEKQRKTKRRKKTDIEKEMERNGEANKYNPEKVTWTECERFFFFSSPAHTTEWQVQMSAAESLDSQSNERILNSWSCTPMSYRLL